MTKKTSKGGIKFRRFIYRLGKYSMFVFTVVTFYNLTAHIIEIRKEKIKREKRIKALTVILSVIFGFVGFILSTACIIKYIKQLKKGYLLDLFDTEAYDVIDPDEEFPAESIIKSELCGNEDTADHEMLITNHIPLDEEASEEDY